MLLPPGQRLAEDLPSLVHVEVSGTQETQYVLVLGDLHGKRRVFCCTYFDEITLKNIFKKLPVAVGINHQKSLIIIQSGIGQ